MGCGRGKATWVTSTVATSGCSSGDQKVRHHGTGQRSALAMALNEDEMEGLAQFATSRQQLLALYQ